MPLLVFLVDTSSSMNQRTHLGTTLLDIAKGAVETFMKLRSRDQASRTDRFMLVSCDEPPGTIKAGWKDNHLAFMNELKNLQATSLTGLGQSLKMTFDLVNINRLYSGIDNYGQGRNPFYLEPAMIIAITDGHRLTNNNGVQDELLLPMSMAIQGGELTKEPFRWDQRLFSLVLRIPGVAPVDNDRSNTMVSVDGSPINAMCEVTGGRSYAVTSMKTLNQCLESLVQKVQNGVVVNFEKVGSDPAPLPNDVKPLPGSRSPMPHEGEGPVNGFIPSNGLTDNKQSETESKEAKMPTQSGSSLSNLNVPNANGNARSNTASPVPPDKSWHNCRKLIYVRPNPKTGLPMGQWPIPESFWPDVNAPTLQPRDAQPAVKFMCTNCEPMLLDNLPFDKYELEPSPLTQYILERRNPNVCWQVFVANSGKNNELGHPFGYLKASSNLVSVNLFIMPYNYPVLLPLLDDLFKVHRLKPSPMWRQAFENYLRDVPSYYAGPLKIALRRMGAPNVIPDGMENCLSYTVVTYLKRLKQQSKVEADRMAAMIAKKQIQSEVGIKVMPRSQMPSLAARKDFQQLLQAITGETVTVRPDSNITEFPNFTLHVSDRNIRPQTYRNSFDIPRKELLDQLVRMRTNFLQLALSKSARFMNEDKVHSIPMAEMGNYQEYLKRMPSPLREADPAPARLHTFGNPFKLASDKDKQRVMVDEADVNEAMTGPQQRRRLSDSPPGSPSPKRVRSPATTPPSRRPTSPGVQGGIILKKPLAQLLQSIKKATYDALNAGSVEDSSKQDTKQSTETNQTPVSSEEKTTTASSDSVQGTQNKSVDPELDQLNMVDQGLSVVDQDLAMTTELITDAFMSELEMAPGRTPEDNGRRSPTNERNPGKRTMKEENVAEANAKLKREIVKEVRKPGRDFSRLFMHLHTLQGDLDTKMVFVNGIIREAGRFKRRRLIEMLEAFQQALAKYEMNHNNGGGGAAMGNAKKKNKKIKRNHIVASGTPR
ncbi:integrator complex subunit 6-like isoform X1 [Asterias rubens]|uniref:integrator complex subunit 6-like isoform X1 n=1 Tax=Asterias rubens TaxID=7604 RepID=UPI00145521FD|nr:integrator complex subunit 6-like isoform X1 [Asterias rubens]